MYLVHFVYLFLFTILYLENLKLQWTENLVKRNNTETDKKQSAFYFSLY